MKAEDTDCYDKPALFSYREVANLMLESRKAGIKEVVEWIRSNEVWIHLESSMAWQSKLKEWGIE